MGRPKRYESPYGSTAPRKMSPLPQGYAHGEPATPVRLVHGFLTTLPGRTRLFFQRQFFSDYPRPLQQGGASPFPRNVDIATIVAPKRQAIVLREVTFRAYQFSGIGQQDVAEVPSGRAVGTLGFAFRTGNRGLTDFQTNLPGTGTPVSYGTVAVKQGGTLVAPRAGQGNIYQGTGTITPNMPGENFAAYVRPGDEIKAQAVVFRPPNFDLRLFEVVMSGWLADERELDKIVDKLTE